MKSNHVTDTGFIFFISYSKEVRCLGIVTSSFGMAIGYMYLKKEQYKKAKIEVSNKYICFDHSNNYMFANHCNQKLSRK